MMDKKELYPLSYPQRDIYNIHNFYQGNSINNIIGNVLFESDVDPSLLRKAIEQLIKENDTFQLRFIKENKNVYQFVDKLDDFNIMTMDFLNDYERYETWLEKMNYQKIDIFEDSLYIFVIYIHPNGSVGYYFRLHHIISDAWTMTLIANEINENYVNLLNNEVVINKKPSYIEFLNREKDYLQSKRFAKDKAFWEKEFETLPETKLFDIKNTKQRGTSDANRLSFSLSKKLTNQIQKFCKKNNISMFTFFLSCISAYFYKTTSKQDFVLGTVILNRTTRREKDTIGMFINSMPVRIQMNDDFSLVSLSKSVNKKFRRLLRHQKYPNHLLMEDLRKSNDLSDNLYDVMVSYQNATLNNSGYLDYDPTWHFNGHSLSPLTFHINDRENTGEIEVEYDYLLDLFTKSEIGTIHKYFIQLMENLVNDDEQRIKNIDILNQKQIKNLLKNTSDIDYPHKTLHELFKQQVIKHPKSVAIEHGTEEITYQELDQKSNQLACFLRENQVKPNDIVALYFDRSIEMIVSVLAVLKSGAAYLPIDPTFPKERIEYMLSNSEAHILLTTENYIEVINDRLDYSGTVINVQDKRINELKVQHIPNVNSMHDLAYIIYTSGSTGNPKGVMIEHRNVVQLLMNDKNLFDFTNEDVWTMFHSYCFDFSVWEMYGALLYGGKLVIVPPEVTVDSSAFIDLLIDKKVTILNQTPSAFYNLIHKELESKTIKDFKLKQIIFGGEALKPIKLKEWKLKYPHIQLINMYGITETTVHVTYKELTINDINKNLPNIGKPLPPLDVYILDSHLNMQPEGTIGEICVSGKGLAKGYLNNKDLTDSVFVNNPFIPGEKMYKSGDLGRILPNGELEYIGRKDFQVKIRGYRVELGEIERELLNMESIKECVVLNHLDKSENTILTAYLLSKEEINPFHIRKYLATKLPEYMIPSRYIKVDSIPLTSNGKVDRNKLEEYRFELSNHTITNIETPKNAIEEKLLTIWKQELQLEKISIHDSFFHIGGHSLNASYLVMRINQEFGVKLSIGDIFTFPTIELLGKYIQSLDVSVSDDLMIKPIARQSFYPTSSAEKRMFTIWKLDKRSLAYNMPGAFHIKGEIDITKLKLAIQDLVTNHEVLRSTFQVHDGEITRRINPASDNHVDLKTIKYTEPEVKPELLQSLIEPFDLENESLIRFYLLVLGKKEYVLFMDMHHIISDALTVGQIMKDLSALYNDQPLHVSKLQYKEYAAWEQKYKNSKEYQAQKEYWLNQFKHDIPMFQLPTDYRRSIRKDFKGNRLKISLSKSDYQMLKDKAKALDISPYMYLLTCYQLLLSKWAATHEVVLGIPVNVRSLPETKHMLGMFINTLVLRTNIDENKTFAEITESVKDDLVKALENQHYPFDELVQNLQISGQQNRTPIIDTMFVWNENQQQNLHFNRTQISFVPIQHQVERFDITCEVNETDESIELEMSYTEALYSRKTIEHLLNTYKSIVLSTLDCENTLVKDISLTTSSLQKSIKHTLNDRVTFYPNDTRVETLFERQANMDPTKIAINDYEGKISYQELDYFASNIALNIIEKDIPVGSRIAIVMERSSSMIAALLGVLKAGCTYVPIDASYPEERINYILEDSNCLLILTDALLVDQLHHLHVPTLTIEKDYTKKNYDPLKSIAKQVHARQPIYIIYTSGSTGHPKGVVVHHYSVNRLVRNTNYIQISNKDNLLQLSSFAFDGSVFDIYGALLNGAELTLISKENLLDLTQLAEVIKNNKVSIAFMTTALFNTIVERKIDLLEHISNKILFGGERVSVKHVEKAFQLLGNNRLIHVYGPTEGTVYSSFYPINKSMKRDITVPIGKAISNTELYVLDKQGNLCPPHIPGELYIGGDGLAEGYLNLPEMNDEAFIQSPFNKEEKLYRTGDLVYINSEDNLIFLDRIDTQVKIRGHRIELSEIEQAFVSIDGVKEVYVESIKDNNHNDVDLVAYVVAVREIKESELATILPSYMIPSYMMFLDKMPLNQNGKIDKKQLPKPVRTGQNQLKKDIIFENPDEKTLATMWEENLGVSQISREDHYFQVGGHSLKATILADQIKKYWKIDFTIKDVLEHPILKDMSKQIQAQSRIEQQPFKIKKAKDKDHYPLSFSEKSMYFLWLTNPENVAYNIPSAVRLKGRVDIDRLRNAYDQLIERHESFRTTYHLIKNEPYKMIHEFNRTNFQVLDYTDHQHISFQHLIEPFDLNKGEVIRAKLIKLNRKDYILFIDMHHIAADGFTINVFYKELAQLYNGERLEPLTFQYKDFSEWQQTYVESDAWLTDKNYWLNEFSGEQPVLNFPTDFERKGKKSYRGKKICIDLDDLLIKKLNKLATNTDSTLYMILMSIYGLVLGRYAHQDEVVIGTPTYGRVHSSLNNVAGMFVNSLPVKLDANNNQSVEEYLKRSKQKILNALQHQNYSFEELVDQLKVVRSNDRNPLFDVMFAMNYTNYDQVEFHDLDLSMIDIDHRTEKFDMTLEMNYSSNQKGSLTLTYDSDLFTEDTMKIFLDSFIAIAWQMSTRLQLFEINLNTPTTLKAIDAYNQTTHKLNERSVIDLFEIQAQNKPDHIALEYLNQHISYKELHDKVHKMSLMLQSKGVRKGSHVAIVLERSKKYIVSVLSILKLGAVFIPIDVKYPNERKEYIIHDSMSDFVITHSSYHENWLSPHSTILVDEMSDEQLGHKDLVIPDRNVDDVLYVLYTSGSTGNPKGVKVKGKSLVNYITWAIQEYAGEKSTRCNMPLFTSISFDLTLTSIFVPLLSGSTVTIYPETEKEMIEEVFQHKNLDIVKLTPGYLRILNNYQTFDNHIHTLVVGGESLSTTLCQSITDRYEGIRIFNEYGPTEATVGCIVHQYDGKEDKKKSVFIGKPINNTKIFIMDANRNIQPPGAIGEIYIAGIQVAAGYLNNPKETDKRFVYDKQLNMTLYRTGDFGRLNSNGKIEYLGRTDKQVKVRGYRIELGEIETHLLQMPNIKNAVVLDQPMPNGDINLVSYIVSHAKLKTEDIKDHLLTSLPTYMVPSYYVFVDQIPLTNNGKIDTDRLPKIEDILSNDVPLETDLTDEEAILMQLARKVLKVNKLSIHHNFFEVGGNSLSAVYLVNEIVKVFGVKLEISDVFSAHHFKDLAGRIKDKKNSFIYQPISKVKQKDFYDVSFPQRRMFLIQYMNPLSVEYNMPIVINVKNLDRNQVEATVNTLLRQHRILRTNFRLHDGHVLQEVKNERIMKVEVINTSSIDDFDYSQLVKPFDLGKDLLLRMVVIKNSNGEDRLFLDIHHIILDGISMNQFMEEFCNLYNHSNLCDQTEYDSDQIDYIDYTYWYNERLKSSILNQQEGYWLEELSHFTLAKSLPYDHELTSVPNSYGSQLSVEISTELNRLLNKYVMEHSTTKYIVLLTTLFTLCHKYNPVNEPIIGTPVSGRNHPDVNNMLGLFINTLAIRSKPTDKETVEQYLERVKEKFLRSLANADYQYDQLINHPDIRKILQNEELFEVMFVYQNYEENEFNLGEHMLEITPVETNTAKFNLTLAAIENKDKQLDRIVFEYKSELFSKETIETVSKHYLHLLEQILRQGTSSIQDLTLWKKDDMKESKKQVDFSFEF